MMGAIVVIALAGLVFPIVLLLLALAFDAIVVMWVAFGYSRDHWAQVSETGRHLATRLHIPLHRPHAPVH